MKKCWRSMRPEIRWAIGIGTALYVPAFWVILIPVGAWKAGGYLWLQHAIWQQGKRGVRVLDYDGRKFACWVRPDGTTDVREIPT